MSLKCTTLPYTLNAPSAPTVAFIVLQTDEVLEDELRHWLTPGTRVLHTRIANDSTVNADTLGAMADRLPHVIQQLPHAAPIRVLAYGCTSASTVIGESNVEAIVQQQLPDVMVTNPLTALKANLRFLDAKRIGLLTPYEPAVSEALHQNLSDSGFDIVSFASFNEPLDTNVCRIDEASLKNALRHLHTEAPCDALFASCTNLRTATWLDEFSKQLGIPVLSSNSALSWHVNSLLDKNIIEDS